MKVILLSIGVIILLLAVVITNAIYINLILESLENGLANVDGVEGYERLYKEYMHKETFLSLTVEDERLLRIEGGFLNCVGYSKSGKAEELQIEKSRLLSELGQLKRLSWFDIQSVM